MNDHLSQSNAIQGENTELMYEGLGHVIRALHDALAWVGAENILAEASNEFPTARERLSHIASLTERAANTVLSHVEENLPIQKSITEQAEPLLNQWQSYLQNSGNFSAEELAKLASATHGFIAQSHSGSLATQKSLSEIMMAQDFQDLTGQLIKKIVSLLERTETDLLQLLIQGAPAGSIAAKKQEDVLAGPGSIGYVMMEQENVDDLLADLGF